ncbi:MAG: TRAP transporter small permease subunit [Alphaproteobacteria bacterium]
MPTLDFTLPHWMYWIGLILFPVVGMVLARRAKPKYTEYSVVLAAFILVTGGILGLHRFYLKNLLGLVYIPIFIFVLYSNAVERDARSDLSDANNLVRVAERTLEREMPRLNDARAELPEIEAEVAAALAEDDPESFALRSANRRLERAQDRIQTSEERIAQAESDLAAAQPIAASASETRALWSSLARYTFYLILAMLAVDLVLLPRLVRKANDSIVNEPVEEMVAEPPPDVDGTETKPDHEFAHNWVDRLSLYAGEYVSYWAVIAVFVYYYEVISRYVFNSPTSWAHEGMYLMFGMQYLIAGAYAALTEQHVRVDIFYANMSPRRKAITDLLTSVFFFIFAGTLLVTSYIFAVDANAVPTGNSVFSQWARGQIGFFEVLGGLSLSEWTDPNIRWGEISFNEWEIPLWPMKWLMVVGGLLLVLQGGSKVAKDIRTLSRGY